LACALRRYKYDRDVGLAPLLGRLLAYHCPLPLQHDIAIPVPLHRQRLRWRGFNQSALIARRLASDRGILYAASVLQRRRSTPPQVGLSEAERRTNISGAFSVRDPESLRGRSVLLVDDVYTTGATANECARTLKRAGARRVDVLVLARAL
jgi:ComF family protein